MIAFVLAAGKGERLWPFTAVLPKTLWPVGGMPSVRWIIERLDSQLKDLESTYLICLKKDKPLFDHEFRDMNVTIYSTTDPLGTAGQVADAVEHLNLKKENELLVHYGDCLVNADYGKLIDRHRDAHAAATLLLTSEARSEYGQAQVESSEIIGFVEKPVLGFPTWTGVAVMNSIAHGFCAVGKDLGADVFPRLLKMQLHLACLMIAAPYWDIGTFRSYSAVNELATEGLLFR